jgi:D-threo-aldose 1-dehydrogenase
MATKTGNYGKKTAAGSSKLMLPRVIFGTSALGNLYQELDYNTKLRIVSECLNLSDGPVVFDSAGKYGAGLALEELGKILHELNADPQKIMISNKLGWLRTPLNGSEPDFEKGVWVNLKHDAVQDISYSGIIKCWEQGIELLGEKYAPRLVSVHDPDEYLDSACDTNDRKKRFLDIMDAYKALFDLKDKGGVEAVGVGAKNWRIIREICQHVNLDWVMFANSMTIMNHPAELVDFMNELSSKGVTIVNSAVFQAGFLLGGDYYDYKKIRPDTSENIARFTWRSSFHQICKDFDINPMTACVNFALHSPGVSSVALNTSKPNHVKENIESCKAEMPLDFYPKMKEQGLIRPDYSYV